MVCKKCRLLEVCMANLDLLENSIPVAPLKLAALPGSMEMAKKLMRIWFSSVKSSPSAATGFPFPDILRILF